MARPRESAPLPIAWNCFSIQAKASANKTLDFFAAAPPYFCSSEHKVPTGQPPRAKASRFLILMSTNPQRRSLGELALLRSCNRFLNREMRSSTMAPPISSFSVITSRRKDHLSMWIRQYLDCRLRRRLGFLWATSTTTSSPILLSFLALRRPIVS